MNLQRELSKYKETLNCCRASIWAEKNANGYVVVGKENDRCPTCTLASWLCGSTMANIEQRLNQATIGDRLAQTAIRRG